MTGKMSKGGGGFRIDHPLEPATHFLSHSFVESPDMKNLYDGMAILDDAGVAIVALPRWFEALNADFRYLLTAIDAPGPNLHIAAEIAGGQFQIAGGSPGMKVSWQVTGTRCDPWAEANRILVEEEKETATQGRFLHPDLYGAAEDDSITRTLHPFPVAPTPPQGRQGTP